MDDNFNLAAGSPAIDVGDGFNAPFEDLFDRARHDDPATPNSGIGLDKLVEADTGVNSFATTGTLNRTSYLLPITFPFYGTNVDGDDLVICESQHGQPALAIAAVSSSAVETPPAAELTAAIQVEATTPLASTPEESVASRFPANFIIRSSDVGLGFSLTASQQEPVEAEAIAEYIDEAFNSVWSALPEQHDDPTSDEFVLAADGDSTEATQSADEAFASLADDEGFAGL